MTRIPDWKVEQLALGVLSEGEAAALRADLKAADDPRLQSIEHSNAEILADYPPELMAAKIRRRLESATEPSHGAARGTWWLGLAVGAVAVAVAGWWVVRMPASDDLAGPRVAIGESPAPEVIRLKGGEALLVYRQVDGGREQLRADAPASAGDVLQVAYRAADAEYGTIVSIDGRGSVTLHFPSDASASTKLRKGGAVALPHGYELDDAPEFERFIFVTSRDPVDVGSVREAAKKVAGGTDPSQAALGLKPGQEQISFVVRKSGPR